MGLLDVVILGAAKLVDGIATWQASVPVGDDTEDVETFGEIDVIQSLGITSTPYPKDESGYSECVVARDLPGRVGVCIGARDTRNAGFLGKQSPGDSTLHATGPGAVAQCFVKNEKRQAGLATENSKAETMVFVLDGKNDKGQWACNGALIEIDPDGDISLVTAGGAAILLQGGDIFFRGNVHLPGINPGMALMQGPQTGSPGGAAAAPMFAVNGVGG
jgi:hypothetical protein